MGIEHLLAGCGAGLTSTLILHPLDFLKIRFQVQDGAHAAGGPTVGANARPYYNGLVHAIKTIVKTEGRQAMYQGLSANVAGSAAAWGSYFFADCMLTFIALMTRPHQRTPVQNPGPIHVTASSSFPRGDKDHVLEPHEHMSAALLAGIGTMLITNPIWVVKTRMCLQVSSPQTAGKATATAAQAQYRGLFHGLTRIWSQEGILGLYSGIVPALWSTMHGSIQFVIYEDLKQRRIDHTGYAPGAQLPTADYFAIAAISKTCATTMTYPLQVLRSRLQDHTRTTSSSKRQQANGMLKLARQLWQHEGVKPFYRGLLPNLIRVMPSTCITFVAYEHLHRLFKTDEADDD